MDVDTGKPLGNISLVARRKLLPGQKLPPGEIGGYWPESPTDGEGRFRFTNLPEGEFTVRSITWGYQDVGPAVTGHSGQKESVTLKVKKENHPR